MITLGLILFILAFFIHDTAKALADARSSDSGNTPLHKWAVKKPNRFIWYTGGDPYKEKQGLPWTCDFWHLFDGHVRIWMIILGAFGFGTTCWFSAIDLFKNGMILNWYNFNPLWAVPIGFIAYMLAGELFKYLFHIIFIDDWTLKKFWQEFIW